MPELIVYDGRNNRLHVNTVVRYRGMRCVVTKLVSTKKVDVKIGAIVHSNVDSSKVQKL